MNRKIPKIFLSYSWKNHDVADQIDKDFEKVGINLIRDVRDAENFKSIPDFIKRVGESDYVIMLISKQYLESRFCMYEVMELLKIDKFEKRALPITLDGSEGIYESANRKYYYDYWRIRLNEMSELVNEHQTTDFTEEKRRVEFIKLYLDDFFRKFISIKTINFKALQEENYSSLFKRINYTDTPLLEEVIEIGKIEDKQEQKIKLDEFLTKYPKYVPAIFYKARLCEKFERFVEAKLYFRKVIELDNKHDWAYVNLGAILSNKDGEHEQAMEFFEKALSINPLNETALENIGIVYNKTSRHEQAIQQFKKIIDEINPTNAFAYDQIGATYQDKLLDFHKAKQYFEATIRLEPKDPRVISVYKAYAKLQRIIYNDYTSAMAAITKSIELDGQDYDSHIELACIRNEGFEDYEGAIKSCKDAIVIDPNKAWPYTHIADIYAIHLNDYKLAEHYYWKAIEAESKSSKVYSDLGRLYYLYLKDYLVAKIYFERALAIDEHNFEANFYCAVIASKAGDKSNQKLYAKNAVLAKPDSVEANINYGDVLFWAGDLDEAAKYYYRAIALSGLIEKVYLRLAQIYVKKGKIKLAKAFCEQEIRVNPNYSDAYNSLGAILSNHLSKHEEAKCYFKKAIELNPTSALAYHNMGVVVENLNGPDAAKYYFDKANDLGMPDMDSPEVLK